MGAELIERATKIANKGVQKDDGYRYSVPAADLAEYAAVIHELVAELTQGDAETNPEWGVRWTRRKEPNNVTNRGEDEKNVRAYVQKFPHETEAVVRDVTGWRPAPTEGGAK